MKLTFDNFDEDLNDENENDYDLDVIMNHEYCDPYLFFNLNQDHMVCVLTEPMALHLLGG